MKMSTSPDDNDRVQPVATWANPSAATTTIEEIARIRERILSQTGYALVETINRNSGGEVVVATTPEGMASLLDETMSRQHVTAEYAEAIASEVNSRIAAAGERMRESRRRIATTLSPSAVEAPVPSSSEVYRWDDGFIPRIEDVAGPVSGQWARSWVGLRGMPALLSPPPVVPESQMAEWIYGTSRDRPESTPMTATPEASAQPTSMAASTPCPIPATPDVSAPERYYMMVDQFNNLRVGLPQSEREHFKKRLRVALKISSIAAVYETMVDWETLLRPTYLRLYFEFLIRGKNNRLLETASPRQMSWYRCPHPKVQRLMDIATKLHGGYAGFYTKRQHDAIVAEIPPGTAITNSIAIPILDRLNLNPDRGYYPGSIGPRHRLARSDMETIERDASLCRRHTAEELEELREAIAAVQALRH